MINDNVPRSICGFGIVRRSLGACDLSPPTGSVRDNFDHQNSSLMGYAEASFEWRFELHVNFPQRDLFNLHIAPASNFRIARPIQIP